MFEDYIIVVIGGRSYYVEANKVSSLKHINGKLVNISNSSITLVTDFDYQYNTYPRITCPSMSQCRLQLTQNSNYTGVTDNISYNKNNLSIYSSNIYMFILMFFVSVYCLYKIMIKR